VHFISPDNLRFNKQNVLTGSFSTCSILPFRATGPGGVLYIQDNAPDGAVRLVAISLYLHLWLPHPPDIQGE
jgi:hypothetical protein